MADSSSWETVGDDSWETALALVRRLTTTTESTAHPPPDAALLDELESLIGQVRQQHHHNPAAAPPPSITPPPIIDSSLSDLQIRRDVKAATVRIGLYDRRDKVFFNLGSGSIVSAQGHILTAAHLFVGPMPRAYPTPHDFSMMYCSDGHVPRFRGRDERRDLVIAIGVYEADDKPSVWRYYAELVTPEELLKQRLGTKLLDLACVQIKGTLSMDPPAFRPARRGASSSSSASFLSEQYELRSRAPFAFDKEWELPAVLRLGNPEAVATGQPRLAVAGWPSPMGEHEPYFDNTSRTLIAKSEGYLKTDLFVHSASSGGPCVDMKTGTIVGITSFDNGRHGQRAAYASFFRKVSLLTPLHGLPEARIAPAISGSADTGELSASPLSGVGPFEMVALDDAVLEMLHVSFERGLIGGALHLVGAEATEAEEENGGGGGGDGDGDGDGDGGSDDHVMDAPMSEEDTDTIPPSVSASLSPVHTLTLSRTEREAAGIPSTATHFAFVYPTAESSEGGGAAALAASAPGLTSPAKRSLLESFLDVGGFIYFSSDHHSKASGARRMWALLSGSSLTPCKLIALVASKGKGLTFERVLFADIWPSSSSSSSGGGGSSSHRVCYNQLLKDGRLHDVTIEPLQAKRVRKFCWLFPSEFILGEEAGEGGGKEGGGKEGSSSSSSSSIGGGSGCDGAQHWPHGGFAYFYDERDAQHDCVFAVASVASADAASLPVKRTSSSLQQQPPSKRRHAAERGGAR